MLQTKRISMLDLKLEYEHMKGEIDSAVKKCFEHQKWILGPEVKELETNLAGYLGAKHCIGVSSGTEALVLSLRALAIKTKGKEYFDKTDEIITTPFTFTATGDAILRSGATPVFVDIDPASFNIDPEKVKSYLESNSANVVGMIPVHLYGQSADMDKIMALAKKQGLFVVEDVAQAFGGMWKGQKLGAIGDLGAFSFFPSKNLGCFGDGGLVSTNNPELAETVRMLLKHGGRDKYNVDHIGYNARLDTLQAAILLAKLKYIDSFNEKRRGIAKLYNEGFKGPAVSAPGTMEGAHHVFHQYTLRIKGGKRDSLQKHLNENGVDSMVYYPVPLHKMKVFEGRCKTPGSLANSEAACLEVLSLPVEPLMDTAMVNEVIAQVNSFAG